MGEVSGGLPTTDGLHTVYVGPTWGVPSFIPFIIYHPPPFVKSDSVKTNKILYKDGESVEFVKKM
jgi:hypothetical protein